MNPLSVIGFHVRKIHLEYVQVMAGHRYPSTTEQYVKLDELEQRGNNKTTSINLWKLKLNFIKLNFIVIFEISY